MRALRVIGDIGRHLARLHPDIGDRGDFPKRRAGDGAKRKEPL